MPISVVVAVTVLAVSIAVIIHAPPRVRTVLDRPARVASLRSDPAGYFAMTGSGSGSGPG